MRNEEEEGKIDKKKMIMQFYPLTRKIISVVTYFVNEMIHIRNTSCLFVCLFVCFSLSLR